MYILKKLEVQDQPILINSNRNECNNRLDYYPFVVNLGIYVRSCNTLFLNELNTLAKHGSCDCKCKFDGRKYNSNQKCNK